MGWSSKLIPVGILFKNYELRPVETTKSTINHLHRMANKWTLNQPPQCPPNDIDHHSPLVSPLYKLQSLPPSAATSGAANSLLQEKTMENHVLLEEMKSNLKKRTCRHVCPESAKSVKDEPTSLASAVGSVATVAWLSISPCCSEQKSP